MRLRAAMQAGRRQRKTSQNEDEVQIFIAEKSWAEKSFRSHLFCMLIRSSSQWLVLRSYVTLEIFSCIVIVIIINILEACYLLVCYLNAWCFYEVLSLNSPHCINLFLVEWFKQEVFVLARRLLDTCRKTSLRTIFYCFSWKFQT